MSPLQSIVYVSTAAREMSAAELEDLLLGARVENRRNDVTGVLFYDGGNFMQCFEGPADAMPETYRRICESRLHHGIVELLNGPVAQRSFEGWEMALARPTSSQLLALSTARWNAQASLPAEPDTPDGLSLMQSLWRGWQR